MRYFLPIFHKICRILVGMYLLCLRSPRCDFELIFIVYLVGDVAARHPSPRVHQLGDPSNSIWSYSRNYNQTRCEVINLFWLSTPCPLEYSRIKNKIGPLQAPLNALLHTTQSYCLNNFEKKVVALTLIGMGFGRKKNGHLYSHRKYVCEGLNKWRFVSVFIWEWFGILNEKCKGIKIYTLVPKKVYTWTGQSR